MNKLNTLYCKHWIPRYNTVQIKTYFSDFEPYRFGPRRGRIAVRSVLKWRHPQLFRALNTALTKSWTNRRHGWPCRRANFSRLLQASTCKCHERKRTSYGRVKKLALVSVTKWTKIGNHHGCSMHMSKGTLGQEGSVGSFVAVCEARCGLAVEDTSKFVEKLSHLWTDMFSYSSCLRPTNHSDSKPNSNSKV